jgi:glycosyltransferase involved in cell wall biosynthesis
MVSYSVYDGDNRVRRYGEALVNQGYEVDAFALWRIGHQDAGDVINGVRVYRIQGRIKNEKSKFDYLWRLLTFFFRSLWAVTREHWKQPYNLIHIHSVPDFEVFAAVFAKVSGAKVILDIHDIVPEFYASKFNVSQDSVVFKALVGMERVSAAFADHVIASNHIWEKRLESRSVPKEKVTTIINYPNLRLFQRQGRTRSDDKFIMLYPGSLAYHQGLDLAIRAFSRIHEQVPQAEFHIYGSGDQMEFLKALVAQLGLGEKVLFKGSLVAEKLVRIMENADLGVVPKRKSGFGNEAFSTKIPEFMAMGVPLVVPDTEIDRYYFNDEVAKFFEADNEASLADAMVLMIRDSGLRERLVENASKFVEDFSWDKNQVLYLDVVRNLMKPMSAREAEVPVSSSSQQGK